jgi:sRNA-binding protein
MNEEKIFSDSQPLYSGVKEQSQPLKKMDKFRAINAWLLQIYPLCFRRKKPQPLKHTILEDILETYPFDDVLTCDNLREN